MYNLPIWFNFSFIRTLSIAYYLVQHWLKYIIIMFPLREPAAHLVPKLWVKYYSIVIYRTVSVNVIIGLSGRCVWSELSVISEVAREQRDKTSLSLSLPACLQSVSQLRPCVLLEQRRRQLLRAIPSSEGGREGRSSEKNSNLFSCDQSDSPTVKHSQVAWRGQRHCETKILGSGARQEWKT